MIPEFVQDLKLKRITVKKGVLLTKQGDVCQHLYFIKSGCIRLCFTYRKKELTTQFFFEGEAVTIVNSFLFGEVSHLSMQVLKKCELMIMDKEQCNLLLQSNKPFINWFYPVVLQIESHHAKHLQSVMSYRAQERYQALLENHPEWLTRVPKHVLSSYLGISPAGLYEIIFNEMERVKKLQTE